MFLLSALECSVSDGLSVDYSLFTYSYFRFSSFVLTAISFVTKKKNSYQFFFFFLLQTVKEPLDMRFRNSSCNQASLVRMDSHASTNGSDDSSIKDWRKIVLEQMYQSLNETEGGLQECIRDALVFHPQGGCTSTIKVHVSP